MIRQEITGCVDTQKICIEVLEPIFAAKGRH
jgi:hypothetical protein